MAHCPNCHAKLHFWNIKAECPHCHINIPNHNWEERLEEDALQREKAFFKLHSNLHLLKYAVIGTPLRLIRLICAVLPLLGYLLPMATVTLGEKEYAFSLILLFTQDKTKLGSIMPLLSDGSNPALEQHLLLALGLAAGALVFAVVAFFLILILLKHPKSMATLILHFISLGAYTAGVLLAKQAFADSGIGTLGIAVWLGIAAFALALILDVIVRIVPIKEGALRYVPTDELQIEYAKSIGAYTETAE